MPIPKKPIPRLRDYSGPAIFSYGFRPFFFFGSIYAALAVMVWLPLVSDEVVNVAWSCPLIWVSVWVPSVLVPSRKVTVPVGVPAKSVKTTAVNVTDWPGCAVFLSALTVVWVPAVL